MSVNWSSPVFIVGASRSGTAMMRSILMQDPDIALAGETHYFDDLRVRFQGRTLSSLDDAERASVADYFRAISVAPYGKGGNPEESPFSREELLSEAAAIGDSIDSVFEAYCKMFARREGATIWGEKTPRHVFRIDEILALYPDARIIVMVRDPRAVVASYRDWYTGDRDVTAADLADRKRVRKSYNIVLATLLWRAAANAGLVARRKYGPEKVLITRYDDVVTDPENTIREVVGWLGIPYREELLSVPLHNSSTMRFDGKAGISAAPQKRWRKSLSRREIGIIQKVAEPCLEEMGFEKEPVQTGPLTIGGAYATLPFAVVRAVMANHDRIGSLPGYVARRLKAALAH